MNDELTVENVMALLAKHEPRDVLYQLAPRNGYMHQITVVTNKDELGEFTTRSVTAVRWTSGSRYRVDGSGDSIEVKIDLADASDARTAQAIIEVLVYLRIKGVPCLRSIKDITVGIACDIPEKLK